MIRRLRREDIGAAADIWLDTNIKAHCFIPEQYWSGHFEAVKEMFLQAEMYVYENEEGIQGFIGLSGDYIAGIFVREGAQSQGIGKRLLDHAKGLRRELSLSVYQKNAGAVRFYQREGFEAKRSALDEDTGEYEYFMVWKGQECETLPHAAACP